MGNVIIKNPNYFRRSQHIFYRIARLSDLRIGVQESRYVYLLIIYIVTAMLITLVMNFITLKNTRKMVGI